MNNRSRRLLDLAHLTTLCMNCGRMTEGCEPAHESGIGAGKGFGIKAHDNRHAALCHDCHSWLDQGGAKCDPSGVYAFTREDRRAMWINAHLRTMDHYWAQGWLRVAA